MTNSTSVKGDLAIDSATDESEANSPIKMTPQEDKGEVVYL